MRHGTLLVISGCMFSEKSAALISALIQADIARIPVFAFKPSTDTRDVEIASRRGGRFPVKPVSDPIEMLTAVPERGPGMIGIDEAQFFPLSVVDVVETLIARGHEIVVAGLDTDFYGKPFGAMPHLLARADKIDKRYAVCMRCGDRRATRTQLLVPAPAEVPYGGPVVLIGDSESYEARCRTCHEPPSEYPAFPPA